MFMMMERWPEITHLASVKNESDKSIVEYRDQKYLTLNFLWRNWIKEKKARLVGSIAHVDKIGRYLFRCH